MVGDVVAYGLSAVMPLITTECFQYRKLTAQFFRLAQQAFTMYPEKVALFPPQVLQHVLVVVLSGIDAPETENAKYALEALTGLAEHALQHGSVSIGGFFIGFLKRIVDTLLFAEFCADLQEPLADALFVLMCGHQAAFQGFIQQILERHAADAQRLQMALQTLYTANQLQFIVHRKMKTIFRKNLSAFLTEMRPILRTR
eukprot:TRINITY_DN6277_c0_g2_i1.p1 TRINITY_DN6277_c0_g2~~TRINITY_DN6277_c0_g2_i1.p1  ORF type:complete len:200 (+),score=60.49 TRINITY_DN6277_c0_g2_i1:284-883(+)